MARARDYFFPLSQDKLDLLGKVFEAWRDFDEYMLLMGMNTQTGEKTRLAVKCSKRGNDVYAKRLETRLNFLHNVKEVQFFEPSDFDTSRHVKANLLWITLTWNPRLYTLQEAWECSYRELHKFKANMENEYGKLEWLTFVQPFPDSEGKAYGYPHFHILVLFKEDSFNAFPSLEKDKDGRLVLRYRIQEKRELEHQGKWKAWIDVQAISSTKGAVAYCKKYAEGNCYGSSDKATLTGAVTWLLRKKSFTLTHGFQKALGDLIETLHVRKIFHMTLDGGRIPEWTWKFYGIRARSELGVYSSDVWVKSLSPDEFEEIVNRAFLE